ncbi:hypothetical protein [Caulobacter sp. 1776]|uniref:DoxX family membrane protein n=1 Tax=Caulobacter sp. 1776 TaxID=3156420 RepID=UPI0033951544
MRFASLSRQVNDLDLGVRLLGLSTIAYGLTCFLQRDFAIYWQPVPDGLPFRAPLAFLSAGLLVLSGAGLLAERTRRVAALTIIGLFALYALCYAPRVLIAPLRIGGVWLGICEQLAVIVGAATIWIRASPRLADQRERLALAVRLTYGVCSIIFGVSHIESLRATITLIPDWAPGGPVFWAVATGLGHVAVGIALITDRLAVPATRIGALMYLSFALLVWTPGAVTHPQQWLRWAGIAISLVMMSALWLVGDYLAPHTRDPAERLDAA